MPTVPTGESAFAERIVIRPAEAPAVELPEPEPTPADLLAIEHGDELVVQHRVEQALTLAAFEHTHRQLMGLRSRYRELVDEVAVDSTPTMTTAFWRAA